MEVSVEGADSPLTIEIVFLLQSDTVIYFLQLNEVVNIHSEMYRWTEHTYEPNYFSGMSQSKF